MKLFGPLEDFVNETLAQFPSRLGKLRFIAEMRNHGRYEHWGMSRTYGDDLAQRAMAEAHADEFEKVLTTPVPTLAEEENNPVQESKPLLMHPEDGVPCDLRGGTRRHFKWILRVVELLHRSSHRPNPNA
jgi:hypothetical protein